MMLWGASLDAAYGQHQPMNPRAEIYDFDTVPHALPVIANRLEVLAIKVLEAFRRRGILAAER